MIYRLGAVELIELGTARPRGPRPSMGQLSRRPYLSSRPPINLGGATLGFSFAGIGSFIAAAFENLFKFLADFISVPFDLASQGVGILFDGLSDLLLNVPILGEFASAVLLLGKTVIQWGLSVPGMLLDGVSNVFGEIKDAINAVKSPEEADIDMGAAKDMILDKAKKKGGDAFRDAIKDSLEGNDVTINGKTESPPNDPPPGGEGLGGGSTDLDKALKWGVPAAGAAAVLLLVLS